MHDPATPGGGYETRDISLRPVLFVGLALVAGLVGSMALMSGLLSALDHAEALSSPKASPLAGYGPQTPPAPQLQTDPARDLRVLRARDASILAEYAWVDRDHGLVRVPIDRAMELLAQRRGQEPR